MKRKFLKLIITFFSIIAITINLNPEISLVDSFSGNSVVLFFMFIIFYSFVNNTNKSKKYKNISIIVAIIFSIMYVLGKSIDVFGDIFIFGNKRQVVKLAISLLGYFWIFYNTLKFIFNLSTKKLMQFFDTKKLSALQSKIFSDNITSLLFVALLIFLSWLPIFLQYYPGVVTNDSLNQIYQGVGEHQLTSHHPVIHTLIIGACMRLGILIRDCNLGIAIYSIFQMIAMSTIFSYSLFYMARKKVPVLYRALTLLYFMFYQVHSLYAISMWKDVLFAGIFLLYTITLIEMVTTKDKFFERKRNYIKLIVLMILVMLFRNNGFYAIIISTPFFLYTFRTKIKNVLFVTVISYVVYAVITGPIYSMMRVEPGSIREALSIPMQQIARTVKYHKDEIPDETKVKICNYIKTDIEEIPNLYNPIISDPIKEKFDGDEFSNNKLDFIKLWFKLLIKYPKDFINAFIYDCYGYWYPDASYWVTLNFTQNDDYLGISEQHKIKSNLIEKYVQLVDKRNIPVFEIIYSIGFNVWMLIILISKVSTRKNKSHLFVFIPLFALWLTTLASPVFCEFRYVYSIFTCQPVLIAYAFLYKTDKEEVNENSSFNTML